VKLFMVSVKCQGVGWIARSQTPDISAVGRTALAAAENATAAAMSMLQPGQRPQTIIVRVEEVATTTIVMQPLSEPLSLSFEPLRASRYHARIKTGAG
jgi:hypothetical protein